MLSQNSCMSLPAHRKKIVAVSSKLIVQETAKLFCRYLRKYYAINLIESRALVTVELLNRRLCRLKKLSRCLLKTLWLKSLEVLMKSMETISGNRRAVNCEWACGITRRTYWRAILSYINSSCTLNVWRWSVINDSCSSLKSRRDWNVRRAQGQMQISLWEAGRKIQMLLETPVSTWHRSTKGQYASMFHNMLCIVLHWQSTCLENILLSLLEREVIWHIFVHSLVDSPCR